MFPVKGDLTGLCREAQRRANQSGSHVEIQQQIYEDAGTETVYRIVVGGGTGGGDPSWRSYKGFVPQGM